MLDAELVKRATDLGRSVLVHLAAGLGGAPVVAAAVGVERTEQSALADHLAERPEARHGALLGDEEGRVDLAGGVVQGDDQVPLPTGCPLMARAVLMQHHAGQCPARPLAPVGAAPGRRAPAAMSLQGQPNPVVAALDAVRGDQLLVKMLGVEVPVAGVEQRQNPRHLVHAGAARRDPAQTAVVQPLRPLRLVAVAPAPEGPFRNTQNLRRLALAQHTPMGATVNLLELHQSQSLSLLRPTHPVPPWPEYVLKPDRSVGT